MMKKILFGGLLMFLLSLFPLIYLINDHYRPYLKIWWGTGRTLPRISNARIKIDGNEIPEAKCFAMKELFNGTLTDSLILWFPPRSDTPLPDIFIFCREHRHVGTPVAAGVDDYRLFDKDSLYQSESGSIMVDFAGPKFDGYNPQLEIKDNYVKFVAPESWSPGGRKIEVFLN